jgi:hypothetical protein
MFAHHWPLPQQRACLLLLHVGKLAHVAGQRRGVQVIDKYGDKPRHEGLAGQGAGELRSHTRTRAREHLVRQEGPARARQARGAEDAMQRKLLNLLQPQRGAPGFHEILRCFELNCRAAVHAVHLVVHVQIVTTLDRWRRMRTHTSVEVKAASSIARLAFFLCGLPVPSAADPFRLHTTPPWPTNVHAPSSPQSAALLRATGAFSPNSGRDAGCAVAAASRGLQGG